MSDSYQEQIDGIVTDERNYWRERAEKAEAKVGRLRDALQEIADTLEPYSFQTDLEDDEARATAGDWNRIRPIALEALREGE